MIKRVFRISCALAIGLVILVGGVWLLSRALADRVELYQGQPAHYWSQRLNSLDAAASNQANTVLSKEIIPYLTNVMFSDTNDSSLRLALVEKLNTLPGILIACTPAYGRRAGAASDLGDFGPAAAAAAPALIQALRGRDQAVRGRAAIALGKIHSQPDTVIPLLITFLDDKELNAEAAEALGTYGALSKAAVPRLISLLEIYDKDLHQAVIAALKKIDPSAAAEAGLR